MNDAEFPFVSVVIPVKNGEGRIEHCLDSLSRQDYPRDRMEVIVADGRSIDGTAEIARARGAVVVDNPVQLVSSGRNAGVLIARGELLAFTDDDCVLPPTWLRIGVGHLADPAVAAVGGPTPIPSDSGPFSRSVDLLFRLASLSGHSVQSGVATPGTASDIPGGNSIYRRSALPGGPAFDEHLLTAEDVDLNLRVRSAGHRLLFAPDFVAIHHKRDSPTRLFHQIRRFAIGRCQLRAKHSGAVSPLHWAAALAPLLGVAIALAIGILLGPLAVVILVATGWAGAVALGVLATRDLRAGMWFPWVITTFLLGWSRGFAGELLFPIRDSAGR
jgi:cellulose synthase/poly-beta-1,6-N-acetylglucosamine synthase-like glycosyltransferase